MIEVNSTSRCDYCGQALNDVVNIVRQRDLLPMGWHLIGEKLVCGCHNVDIDGTRVCVAGEESVLLEIPALSLRVRP